MNIKKSNQGFSLVELIVTIAIMVVLVGIIAPSMVRYIQKAKQVRVEKEASEFISAARLTYVEMIAKGTEPLGDSVKNKTTSSSPYYKNGEKYGNLTNWTVHNGTVAGASNGPFADSFFKTLGISYGSGWQNGSSTITISSSQPKLNPSGSMTKECIFQLFYNKNGDMVLEYSREGYFVRMENSTIVTSYKIKNSKEKLFTSWQS